MDFRPDLFFWLERHENELAVFCGIEHLPKIFILDSETFDILHKSFHNHLFLIMNSFLENLFYILKAPQQPAFFCFIHNRFNPGRAFF